MTTDRQFTRICVFCGTNTGSQPEYGAAARQLGQALAEQNIELVYGGASVGIMGELADSVQEHGGHVTGIIPQQLVEKEAAHTGIPNLIVVASMHQRKSQMADMSDGFIALPGGIGTLEGFFEILTWGQLGIHAKPTGILNVQGYFDGLTGFLDHAVREGFLTEEHRNHIIVENGAARLLDRMRAYTPPEGEKLMGRTHR
ncbi:MAG TPA: TIGR00730 family Rossman fold protein [Gemmatimonadales bacterium]|nr:TIGR00730 family Rossman fold protein [Gemmatimonadales bacterium]